MKNLYFIVCFLLIFTSCKKDEPTLIGNWIAYDSSYQFSIKNTNGDGTFSRFTKKGDELKWVLNGETRNFQIVALANESMILSEGAKTIYFARFR